MRNNHFFQAMCLALLVLLGGCGGGGSTTGAAQGGSVPVGTTINGVASKGIMKNAAVNIYYPPASGDIGGKIFLKSTTTDNAGVFHAPIGTYTGMVLIEVSGGYTDEATGGAASIAAGAPLRAVAVVGSTGGNLPVAVTPLTELATRKALSGGTVLTTGAINSANALVSNLFQFDILANSPVDPSVAAISAASQVQRDYTVVLAAVSKLAASAGSLTAVIDAFYHDLSTTNRLSAATATSFVNAAQSFLQDVGDSSHTGHNLTGIIALSPAVSAVGKYTGLLNLVTRSQGGAMAPITSLQMTLTLPSGVAIKRDATGLAMVAVSGVAEKASAPGVNYIAPSTLNLAIISSPGFGLGQFATATYVADPGTIPVAGDFQVTASTISGLNGTTNDFPIAADIVPVLP